MEVKLSGILWAHFQLSGENRPLGPEWLAWSSCREERRRVWGCLVTSVQPVPRPDCSSVSDVSLDSRADVSSGLGQ